MASLESVLEALYLSDIPVEIRSVWDLGWDLTLGGLHNPQVSSLRDAAMWLDDAACTHANHTRYSASRTRVGSIGAQDTLGHVLRALYDSEFDSWIASVRQVGWEVGIRDLRAQTHVATLPEAARWLHETVVRFAPSSGYAIKWAKQGLEGLTSSQLSSSLAQARRGMR